MTAHEFGRILVMISWMLVFEFVKTFTFSPFRHRSY